MNCVTLRFMNSEMYGRIYAASHQRKYFGRNVLYKNVIDKSPHKNIQVLHKHVYEFK
jgi:prolipoprotein diacylglyceryltransferase